MSPKLKLYGLIQKGDERILGSGGFVESGYNLAEEKIKHQLHAKDLEKVTTALIGQRCKKWKIDLKLFRFGNRLAEVSRPRASLAFLLVKDLGLSLAESAR